MPERFEVEPIPASEIRKGDEILTVSALGSVRKTVFSTRFADPPENGALLTFTDADALNLPIAESMVLRMAARGGTEDQLREALSEALQIIKDARRMHEVPEAVWKALYIRPALCALAARAASTPEEKVYEIERDRFGLHFSGPALANGECVRVRLVDVPAAGRAASTGDDTA